MANLYVAEFFRMPTFIPGGLAQISTTPDIEQKIPFTGTAGTSSAFNTKTRYVLLSNDAICSVAFNATATTSNMRYPADTLMFWAVGGGQTVSAITNT